jgi:GNAT superfamily N-acetyltransferase
MLRRGRGDVMEIRIRRATGADAPEAVNTLRRSITELCTADHQGDARELASWLGNKTVRSWADWIARDDAFVLVATGHQAVVGVGMATFEGEVLLNYVHPDARFSGVSKALLAAVEAELRSRGVRQCRLESTITARRFYEGCGFLPEAANALLLTKSL